MELSHSSVVKLNLQNDEADAVTTKEMERDEVELIGKRSEVMKEKIFEVLRSRCDSLYNVLLYCVSNIVQCWKYLYGQERGWRWMCQSWFYVYSSFWVFGLLFVLP